MLVRTTRPVGLLIVLSLVLAGCSTGGGAPPVRSLRPAQSDPRASAVSLDPNAQSCKLLTDAEAEEAFNQTFNPPVGTDGEPGTCVYFNSAGFGLRVEIATRDAQASFESERAEYGAAARELTGVGDDAFFVDQGASLIMFLKGSRLITLYTASRIDGEVFAELAKLAAQRA